MTPLLLVTGYLGAGKTTFLQAVLPLLAARGVTVHVILNDFRNARVDASRLEGLARKVLPISGHCVCCDSADEILAALADMELGGTDAVLLEANGTADTPALVETLTIDRRAARFTLPLQVTVVNVLRWQKRLWHNTLERTQVRGAGQVVLNRAETAAPELRGEVETAVRALSPQAHVVDATGVADFVAEIAHAPGALPSRRFARGAEAIEASFRPLGHAHVFASVEIPLPARVSREGLEAFLRGLPPEVLRAKGVAMLDTTTPEAVLFSRVDEPDSVSLTPVETPDGLPPVLLCIGAGLPEADLRAGAAALAR